MQRVLKQDDNFKIRQLTAIGPNDYQVILMLYQPLIGVNATNLYLTLLHEKQLTARVNLDFSHARLMQLLDFDQHELLQAFLKLEQHQLLKTYYFSIKATYIYDLQAPLTANNFFANETFSEALKTKLNFLNFERQKYYFLITEPDITEEYNEISNLAEPKYDPVNHIADQLMRHAATQFSQERETKTYFHHEPKPAYQTRVNLSTNQTSYIAKTPPQDLQKTLLLMESTSANDYLLQLTKKPLDEKLRNTIKLLRDNYRLHEGVINCLFEYVYFKNQKRIEPNYILKIAQTFQDNQINDVNSAMQHLKRAYSMSKTRTFNNDYQQDVLWNRDFDGLYPENKKVAEHDEEPILSAAEIQKILHEFDNH